MADLRERARQRADDALRIAGVWPLAVATVSALSAVGLGVWAYIKGAPVGWLLYIGGFASGTLFVLVLTVVVWLVRRRILRKQLLAQTSGPRPKGFLDHKLEQQAAMRELLQLTTRMSKGMVEIGSIMATGTKHVHLISALPEARRDRVAHWIARRIAKKVDKTAARMAVLVARFDATAARLITSQSAFLAFALKQQQSAAELSQLRKSVVQFRDGFTHARDGQDSFLNTLVTSTHATGEIIESHERLAAVLVRSRGVSDRLISHATYVIELIDGRTT